MNEQEHANLPESAIAIVGMSGRFPGAASAAELWQNLANGVKSIRQLEDDEMRAAGVPDALLDHPDYVKVGTELADLDKFDANFFGYNPREAEVMDPQHRLFLECAWEALEDAAYDPFTFDGLIGVFGGSGFCHYLMNNIMPNAALYDSVDKLQVAVGNDRDSLCSTVSYKLNLKGPSVAVQTFCSTSGVAIHMACQSLLSYECDVAMAGGAAITVPQKTGYLYQAGGILSPDGECRTFDANGNGSVMSNGVGVVTLRRLDDAIADGDQIYAVIRGSASNNDGLIKVGYTAPGLDGQAEVIAEAMSVAGVSAETIDYIEAHGTATQLGDSVELAAMVKAFRSETEASQFCAIGSVKPNIGHLDRASGVTGLIKTALALHNGKLPPSLNFESASPDIDLPNSPFYVNTALQDWPETSSPPRAGVSSFGLGGTNVHLVLEQAPQTEPSAPLDEPQVVVLSAKSELALDQATLRLADYLRENSDVNLADVAFTLQAGRAAFNHRRAVICDDTADALEALESLNPLRVATTLQTVQDRPVGFLLPDSAELSQFATLYYSNPSYKATLDDLCEPLDVRAQQLFAASTPKVGHVAGAKVNGSAKTAAVSADVASFVTTLAWAQTWQQWSVRPSAIYATGVANITAACLVGAMDVEEGLAMLKQGGQPNHDGSATPIESDLGVLVRQDQMLLLDLGCGELLSAEARAAGANSERNELIVSAMPDHVAVDKAVAYTLRELWLNGASVDWQAYHAQEPRQRIGLPTYPFERHSYWIEAAAGGTPAPAPVETGKKADMGNWFYSPSWRQTGLVPRTQPEQIDWLIFVDQFGIGEVLAEQYAQLGGDVYQVRVGSQFEQHGEGQFTLRPDSWADMRQLFATLPTIPTNIAHLWSLNDYESFEAAQTLGFYSLQQLVAALNDDIDLDNIELWTITGNAQAVSGMEQLRPDTATAFAASRVIGQENQHITTHHVDVALPLGNAWQQMWLARQLIGEISVPVQELSVAYRGMSRWTLHHEPRFLAPVADDNKPFRQNGTYMITGGLGGVAKIIARYLAETYQANLVLTTRRAFPARDSWADYLWDHNPSSDGTAANITFVQELEKLGATVRIAQADAASAKQMAQAVVDAEAAFGQLHGVLHGAGVSGEKYFDVMSDLTRDQVNAHYQAKVQGTLALEAALGERELDFVLLFSSVSSVLGGLAFGAYVAANQFIDSYAELHNRLHPQWWSVINWDTWQVSVDQHAEVGTTVAQYEMLPAEGCEALERILAQGAVGRLVESTGDLQARVDQWVHMVGNSAETQSATRHPRPHLLTPYVAPTNEAEEMVAEIWQHVLGIDAVGIHDNFLELGGNSLLGTQLISRLRKSFAIDLPVSVLFDAPTVAELAIAIEMAIIEELEALADGE